MVHERLFICVLVTKVERIPRCSFYNDSSFAKVGAIQLFQITVYSFNFGFFFALEREPTLLNRSMQGSWLIIGLVLFI